MVYTKRGYQRYSHCEAMVSPTLLTSKWKEHAQAANQRLEGLFRDYPIGLTALLIFLFFAYHAWYLTQRQVWHDELATYYVVRTFSWASICEALRLTVDAQPPTYHFFQIPILAILGDDPKNLRWLSLFAATATLGAASIWLRRTTGAIGAFVGVAILASSELTYYAVEARPYAPLIAAVAMALASRRLAWRVGWLALAICLHYYAVFIPLLFALSERRWRDRAAYALALLPLLITVPAMPPPSAMDMGGPYAPTLMSLLIALPALAGGSRYVLLLLLLAAFWWAPSRWRERVGGDRLAWALVAMVPICWLMGEWFVGVFFRRYAVISLLGLAGLMAWLVNRMPQRALVAMVVAVGSVAGAIVSGPLKRWDAQATAQLVDRQIRSASAPVVMGQSTFLEVHHYLPLAQRPQFHRLSIHRPSFTTDYAYRPKADALYSEMIGKYAGFVPVGLDDWVNGHSSFVVLATSEEKDWVLKACRQRGATITPGAHDANYRLYTVRLPEGHEPLQAARDPLSWRGVATPQNAVARPAVRALAN